MYRTFLPIIIYPCASLFHPLQNNIHPFSLLFFSLSFGEYTFFLSRLSPPTINLRIPCKNQFRIAAEYLHWLNPPILQMQQRNLTRHTLNSCSNESFPLLGAFLAHWWAQENQELGGAHIKKPQAEPATLACSSWTPILQKSLKIHHQAYRKPEKKIATTLDAHWHRTF